MKIKLRDDSLRMKGWPAFFNKLAYTLLFPLRRPWMFLGILAALYLIPVFIGVKPSKVHSWYWFNIKQHFSAIEQSVSQKAKEIIPEQMTQVIIKTPGDNVVVKPNVEKGVKSSRRKSFGKAEGLQKKDALAGEAIVRLPQAEKVILTDKKIYAKPAAPAQNTESAALAEAAKPAGKKLPLVYLDEEQEITGRASVLNANEISIAGKRLFLYGIYADPNTKNGTEAKIFLNLMLEGKVVRCKINAYTYQNVPTGICSVGDVNINRTLVEKGFSKNVAL